MSFQRGLVPILGHRVKLACDVNGVTISTAARAVGVTQQNLDLIARGVTKTCRPSTRRLIAEGFGVSEKWLAGESDSVPRTLYGTIQQRNYDVDDVDYVDHSGKEAVA